MDKPTILIVPGGFTLPELYDNVVAHVTREGFSIEALRLPSVGYKTDTPGTMQDDAAFIASEVSRHAEAGRKIVLVAHSYGGIPATESTRGLSTADRQRQGKPGGLVRLAYISCIILPVGESDASVIMPDNMMPRASPFEIRLDEDGWLHQVDASAAAANIFNDLPTKQEAERWANMSTRHSGSTFPATLSHAGFKDVPVSYLLCTKDLAQEPDLQRASVAMMEKQMGGGRIAVREIESGHAPNATRPREVADWIVAMARLSLAA
ncbi:hypothetical protein JDV02_010697 [Purpureocillium takamizusanense]|uniref:AB hydrolase-1 domain-containing protein n=1 Tax=Purpureocillium takamizusanense TaxID=2060973 RepID=A0A9Q8QSB5_9HYPO|nr:uncharacterized protein JDV02_010697 [Purpureocillium takamizusanense]UNI24985.1 hypothetical protein JDV02_010697 [Purpureocillium takamizusanense]